MNLIFNLRISVCVCVCVCIYILCKWPQQNKDVFHAHLKEVVDKVGLVCLSKGTRGLGSFYLSIPLTLIWGFHSQVHLMAQDGCWSSSHCVLIPMKKKERGWQKNVPPT